MQGAVSLLAVYFERTAELIARFKKLKGAKWSNTLKTWHLPDSAEYRKRFGIQPESVSIEVLQKTAQFCNPLTRSGN